MKSDGTCPECGGDVDTTAMPEHVTADTLDLKKLAGLENEKLPWHFKLLVAMLVAYLGWRLVDLFL